MEHNLQLVSPREKSLIIESSRDITVKADSIRNHQFNTLSERDDRDLTARPGSVKDGFANKSVDINNQFYDTREDRVPIDPTLISEQDKTKPSLTR